MEWVKENWFKAGLLAILLFAVYKYDPKLSGRQAASISGVIQNDSPPLEVVPKTETPLIATSPGAIIAEVPTSTPTTTVKKAEPPPAQPVLTKEERCTAAAKTEAQVSATDAVKRMHIYNPCDPNQGCDVENTAWFYSEIGKSIEAARYPLILDMCLKAPATAAFRVELGYLRAVEKYCGENFPTDTSSCLADNFKR